MEGELMQSLLPGHVHDHEQSVLPPLPLLLRCCCCCCHAIKTVLHPEGCHTGCHHCALVDIVFLLLLLLPLLLLSPPPSLPHTQAIKTVLYPKAPLLDATTGRLTTPCVKALLRIFLMCDSDGVSCSAMILQSCHKCIGLHRSCCCGYVSCRGCTSSSCATATWSAGVTFLFEWISCGMFDWSRCSRLK
jgi:hypothetical protein